MDMSLEEGNMKDNSSIDGEEASNESSDQTEPMLDWSSYQSQSQIARLG